MKLALDRIDYIDSVDLGGRSLTPYQRKRLRKAHLQAKCRVSEAQWRDIRTHTLKHLETALIAFLLVIKYLTYPVIYLFLGVEWLYQRLRGVLNPKIRIIIAKIIHH